jgi:hypothetical protein
MGQPRESQFTDMIAGGCQFLMHLNFSAERMSGQRCAEAAGVERLDGAEWGHARMQL